ncbi:PhoU domain-containing protein [Paenibacillus sp. sgz302251]|uniref:PhoU domain-containing protein n=1 Tax=Paenibacillus sp. sgz302251 TaxID=3414493 RepID=UPI003C7ED37E
MRINRVFERCRERFSRHVDAGGQDGRKSIICVRTLRLEDRRGSSKFRICNGSNGNFGRHFLDILSNLERVGDHCKNIAPPYSLCPGSVKVRGIWGMSRPRKMKSFAR